jgi:hypothetical protein
MNLPESKYRKAEPDHTKISVSPIVEVNPTNAKDYTVGAGVRIPLDKFFGFIKNLFSRKK